jgi:hypothetical protein
MLKNNKIAFYVFLVLALFNLIFPPMYLVDERSYDKIIFFKFVFTYKSDLEYFRIDIIRLIIFISISLIISIFIQGIYNFFNNKRAINKKA